MSYSLAPDIPEEEKREKRALKSALGMFLLGCGILRGKPDHGPSVSGKGIYIIDHTTEKNKFVLYCDLVMCSAGFRAQH